jgi:hypothetical protein
MWAFMDHLKASIFLTWILLKLKEKAVNQNKAEALPFSQRHGGAGERKELEYTAERAIPFFETYHGVNPLLNLM